MKTNKSILLRAIAIALVVMAGMGQRMSAQEQPVPPPSAPAQLSEDELEKLVAPVALYPDPLLAVMLPASVYPLEIVQASRFVQNPGNLSQIDDQSWDDNVKAVAKFPTVIEYMDTNLQWTIQLGNAFVDQPADVMNAVQTLRAKAQSLGTLQSTPQQVVIVTNAVVDETDLILEQLCLMCVETRAEMVAMRAETNARFDRLESDIADIKKDLREIQTLYDRPKLQG